MQPARLFRSPVRPLTSPKLRGCRSAAAVLAAASALLPALARAEEPAGGARVPISRAECAEAFEQSQRLRNSFQYVQASASALRCADPECGAALSEECGKLYGEIEAATPSIVLGARSEDGTELRDVSVTIDQGARPVVVDGTPLPLDPGKHDLTFVAAGFESLQLSAVVLAGERFRPIIGVLKSEKNPAQTAATGTSEPDSGAPRAARTGPPLASYVLAGVGVAGFAGFIGFRVAGGQEYDKLERDCKPTCGTDSVDAARRSYVLSYVGLAIGGAASIAAVTLYLTSPSTPARQAATLSVRQVPGGMAAQLSAPF